MDKTDVLAQSCSLSKWKGKIDKCRRCDRQLTGRSKKYCTKRCARIWAQNHFYRKARVESRRRARSTCSCPNVRSHIKCSICGICEGKALKLGHKMECDHITPRNGDQSSYLCLHHQDNLRMLCWLCHQGVSRQQRLDRKAHHERQ